ncbi:4Fe-4S binding protein [Haloplasma contractile]|uniref:Iron-sulfur cluster-binding protein n=1 Tax=Haloplasma contractile SSD-17B TaxID=1033810 RepID=U2DTN7_9MOLU|nr:4Fe-4S binding protein [Haloplasma contractile]ERJ11837.1 Iron-sulfur cluster-binding protein [Haloplasma contractile SSD-17B]
MKNYKSHMKWSWVIIVSFFVLSIYNIWFGLFGFVCMLTPMVHALRGKGKLHCAKHCPRGSFLGKWLPYMSLNKRLPKFMTKKPFKHGVLIFMILMLSFSLYHSGFEPKKVAMSLFRFMGASFIVGILLGVIYKPRSWCAICPMGHATGLIDKGLKNQKKKKNANNTKKQLNY